ncbi:MAG: tetratricopeptide repeat protein [Pirellulaceae bacterium]|nr:tetratricopeptide repeat protein [Pirellulaceae bacterium]MDP7017671.1 tetratricopeptide repeat protein [Pirellulaceae bacterium]
MLRPASWILAILFFAPFLVLRAGADEPPSLYNDLLFRPETTSSEASQDRLRAQALFAHSRLLQNRGELVAALRRLQRAWRYAPEQRQWLPRIVALAQSTNRHAEAAEYAALWAETGDVEQSMVLQIAGVLSNRGETRRAIELYERALKPTNDEREIVIRLELGRLYFMQGRHQDAARHLLVADRAFDEPEQFKLAPGKVRQLVNDPALACVMIGEACLNTGRADRAERAFTRAQQFAPAAKRFHLQKARIAVHRKQFSQAAQSLRAFFAEPGDVGDASPLPLYKRLLQLDPQQPRGEYRGFLEQLRQAKPDDQSVVLALAAELADDGEIERAIAMLAECNRSTPSPALYRKLASLLIEHNDARRLAKLLGQIQRRGGDLQVIGTDLQKLLADESLLERLFTECSNAELGDELAPFVATMGSRVALAARRYDEGDALFARSQAQFGASDKSDSLTDWAFSLLEHDRFAQAVEAFRTLSKLPAEDDQRAARHYYLAGALAAHGDYGEAAKQAAHSVDIEPTARYLSRLARMLRRAGQVAEADRVYRQLVSAHDAAKDDSERAFVRAARQALASLAAERQEFAEAEEWLEQILDESPEDIGAMNDLGYLWSNQGKHLQRALAMAVRAAAGEPHNAAYRDTLGWTYFRLERYEDAVRELKAAVEAAGRSPDGDLFDHLGDAHFKLDEAAKALDQWRRALQAFERDKDEPARRRVLEKIRRHTKSETPE